MNTITATKIEELTELHNNANNLNIVKFTIFEFWRKGIYDPKFAITSVCCSLLDGGFVETKSLEYLTSDINEVECGEVKGSLLREFKSELHHETMSEYFSMQMDLAWKHGSVLKVEVICG